MHSFLFRLFVVLDWLSVLIAVGFIIFGVIVGLSMYGEILIWQIVVTLIISVVGICVYAVLRWLLIGSIPFNYSRFQNNEE